MGPTTATQPRENQTSERQAFERIIQALEADILNAGAHGMVEGQVRTLYQRRIAAMAADYRARAHAGTITWSQAARETSEMRNVIMESLRGRSTAVGRAWAESLKSKGRSFNDLVAHYATKRFGANVDFNRLSPVDQDRVFLDVVEAAGRDNPNVSRLMRRISRAGRGLVVLSIGISIYTVATADDPASAARREVAVGGAGIAGGIAGGAVAGLACGPGAPVCVGIGAFVGGALAAFGVDLFWD